MLLLEDGELLAKRYVLDDEIRARAEDAKCRMQDDEKRPNTATSYHKVTREPVVRQLHGIEEIMFWRGTARVGDIFMALLYTAELHRENPFEYLTALQVHASDVASNPKEWMPWTFRATLARLASVPSQAAQSNR